MKKQINFSSIKLHQIGAEIRANNRTEKLHQNGAEIDFPAFFSYVPWRHHVEMIVTKCHSVDEALFYIRKTIEEQSWVQRRRKHCQKKQLEHSNAVYNERKREEYMQACIRRAAKCNLES